VTSTFQPHEGGGRKYIEPYGPYLEQFLREFQFGPSNVVIVRGKDFTEALTATRLAFLGGRSADQPVDPEVEPKSAELWLVAFLGAAGSEPPARLVQSVERRGKSVRVTYRKRLSETKTSLPYFLWVPLGKLESGAYTLELFDADRQEVTLLRRVAW
jgi:hypothetical protein